MDLYCPPMDVNSQYWGGASLHSAAPPRTSEAVTALVSQLISSTKRSTSLFTADSPTALLGISDRGDLEESHATTVRSQKYFSLRNRAVASATTPNSSMQSIATANDNGALAKASRYRAQLLEIQQRSDVSEEILARLSILNRRLDQYAPRVSPEQWQRLERSASVAESAANARAHVRELLRGG